MSQCNPVGCVLAVQAFNTEKILSEAKEDGCKTRTLQAADDQFGSSLAFNFHHSRGLNCSMTSAVLAKYRGNSLFSDCTLLCIRNENTCNVPIVLLSGFIVYTLTGENNRAALKAWSGIYKLVLSCRLKYAMPGCMQFLPSCFSLSLTVWDPFAIELIAASVLGARVSIPLTTICNASIIS